jgi:uncharacterized membrane protein (UPF0127 family)
MINFKQVPSEATQTGKSSVNILGILRGRWHVVAVAASVLCLLLVPFEVFAGNLAAHFTIALALVPIAIIIWRVAPRVKNKTPKTPNHVTIKYACGHSSKMNRAQVAEWAGSKINISQLDLSVSCKQCATAPVAKRKRMSPRLVGSAMAGAIVLVIVAYGFSSGLAGSIMGQATSLSGSITSMQKFASSGGASDLLSGKGSVEDITSLKNAIPGGNKLELAGVEAYSFADGYVAIGEANVFRLEVASTDDEKSRGLSFSEGLQPDQAFLVQNPRSTTVTLMSASFTVDILWLDGDAIVDIAQGATECDISSFDVKAASSGAGCIYKPTASADSILYLDGGMVKHAGIEKGNVLELTLNS